jgi:hypothetical protein
VSLRNAPADERINEVVLKSDLWNLTIVWCEERPGRVESQLNVRSNDFLGQFVDTDCVLKSSGGGVINTIRQEKFGY